MRADDRSELIAEFLQSFGTMVRGMNAIFGRELESYGVTWPQFHLLKVVKRSQRVTVTELSNSLLVAAPTASRMIEGLCSKGLLAKEKDELDHRVIIVRLTPESSSLLDRLLKLQNEVARAAFSDESTKDLEKVAKSLGRVAGKLHGTAERKVRKGVANE
jgi:DNA-binding MarR family transcriptional regulator